MKILISLDSLSSQASEEAAKLGLQHQGFGKYADHRGIVTHNVVNGELIKMEDANQFTVRHTKEYWTNLHCKIKDAAGEQSHKNWQNEYNLNHADYTDCSCIRTTNDPKYIKKHDTNQVDINTDYNLLPSDYKMEHVNVGTIVADYVLKHKNMSRDTLLKRGPKHLHNEWIKANPKYEHNKHLHVQFKHLPDEHANKLKNIVNVAAKHLK